MKQLVFLLFIPLAALTQVLCIILMYYGPAWVYEKNSGLFDEHKIWIYSMILLLFLSGAGVVLSCLGCYLALIKFKRILSIPMVVFCYVPIWFVSLVCLHAAFIFSALL